MSGKRSTRLNNPYDISRYLARIINRLDRGEIDSGTAGKLGYLCNVLRSTMETAELEERVTLLERRNQEEKWPKADLHAA